MRSAYAFYISCSGSSGSLLCFLKNLIVCFVVIVIVLASVNLMQGLGFEGKYWKLVMINSSLYKFLGSAGLTCYSLLFIYLSLF